jgi:hypothetical protein
MSAKPLDTTGNRTDHLPHSDTSASKPQGDVGTSTLGATATMDGSYLGSNHRLSLELRVDFQMCGVISGDLFGTDFGRRDYLASFRTAPGTQIAADTPQPWTVVLETREGTVANGTLTVAEGDAEDVLLLSLKVDAQLPGLPSRQWFDLSAKWQSPMLRQLSVELESETGTRPPPSYLFQNQPVTIHTAFANAGFEILDQGGQSKIPKNEAKWGSTQLHALMAQMANADLTTAAWNQQLLWLGKPTRAGLLGVMFDTTAQLPRQGTALFEAEIRARVREETDRKVIQTAVHELGHSLNLAHRFEREVGRANSTSLMNYDWRYRGGNRKREFWAKFNFSFDPDELEFLRHAPRQKIIPGGAAFHSVTYWADGSGGYMPYLPEEGLDIVSLQIAPPDAGGVFEFGQPVFLAVRMTNTSGQPLQMNRRSLDPKGNFLQTSVRKLKNGRSGTGELSHFHPIVERCFDVDPGAFDAVPHGGFVEDNIQINFGSGGFAFAEPGHYEIQVFGALPFGVNDSDPDNDRELVAASNMLRVYVRHPETKQEELEVATVLQNEDVGTYIALGGSKHLSAAADGLLEVLERRLAGKDEVLDPIAATIVRCLGIDQGRRYPPVSLGKSTWTYGDRGEAARQLQRLGPAAMGAFDRITAGATRRLQQKHLRAAQSQ